MSISQKINKMKDHDFDKRKEKNSAYGKAIAESIYNSGHRMDDNKVDMRELEIGDEIVFKVSVCGCKQRLRGIIKDFGCSKEDGRFFSVFVNEQSERLEIHEEDIEEDLRFWKGINNVD